MTTNPGKTRRPRGRPSKDEELRRALGEIGCDPSAVDPLRILAGIAADESMPPTARVAAAKALLGQRGQTQEDAAMADAQIVGVGAI